MRDAPRDLVLLTHGFEPYLEDEIPYLSIAFERILMVPANPPRQIPPLPANISLDESLVAFHDRRSLRRTLPACAREPAFRRELATRPATLVQPAAFRRTVALTGIALRTRDWLEERIQSGEIDPDRTLFYAYWLHGEAAALTVLRRTRRLTFIARAHAFDLYAERHSPPFIPLQAATVAAASRVFTVSELGRRYLAEKHPASAGRLAVSRLGVPDPGFVSRASADGSLRVLSCSTMRDLKRLDLLVQGLAALARQRPDLRVRWDHLGDGPDRGEVEELARRLLPPEVEWKVHGWLLRDGVRGHYAGEPVDVHVNVSSSEGLPVSIMEALSCGVPVVATAVGGTPELVHSGNGMLLPEDPSPEQVGGALASFADAGFAAGRRRESRRTWARLCDADRNYGQFVESIIRTFRTEGGEG